MKLGASNESAKDKRGATPLHYAIAQGRTESVKALLDCGANVNCKDELGQTPLIWAGKCGQLQTIGPILMNYGADANAADKNGLSLTMDAKFRRMLGGFVRGDSQPVASSSASQAVPLSQMFQVSIDETVLIIAKQSPQQAPSTPTENRSTTQQVPSSAKQTIRQAPDDIPVPSWNQPTSNTSTPTQGRIFPTSLTPSSMSPTSMFPDPPKSTIRQPVVQPIVVPQPVIPKATQSEPDIPVFAAPTNFSSMFDNKVVAKQPTTPPMPQQTPPPVASVPGWG